MSNVDISYGELILIDTFDASAGIVGAAQAAVAYAIQKDTHGHQPLVAISAETFYFSNNLSIGGQIDLSGTINFNELDVSGDATLDASLNVKGNSYLRGKLEVNEIGALEKATTGGVDTFRLANIDNISDISYALQQMKTGETAINSGNNLSLKIGGDDMLSINAAGNVGIGTTNPSKSLEVVGDISCDDLYSNKILTPSGNNKLYIVPNNLGLAADHRIIHLGLMGGNEPIVGQLRFGRADGSWVRHHSIKVQSAHPFPSNNYMRFDLHNGSDGDGDVNGETFAEQVNVMTLRGDGRVGIGMTNPSKSLEVAGDISCQNLYANARIIETKNVDIRNFDVGDRMFHSGDTQGANGGWTGTSHAKYIPLAKLNNSHSMTVKGILRNSGGTNVSFMDLLFSARYANDGNQDTLHVQGTITGKVDDNCKLVLFQRIIDDGEVNYGDIRYWLYLVTTVDFTLYNFNITGTNVEYVWPGPTLMGLDEHPTANQFASFPQSREVDTELGTGPHSLDLSFNSDPYFGIRTMYTSTNFYARIADHIVIDVIYHDKHNDNSFISKFPGDVSCADLYSNKILTPIGNNKLYIDLPGSHYDLSGDYYTNKTAVSTFINDLSSSHYDLSGDYYTNKTAVSTFINDLSSSHYDLSGDYYTNKTAVSTFINDLSSSHYDLSGDYYTNKTAVSTFINDLSSSHYDLSSDYYTNKSSVSTNLGQKQATITGAATTVTSSNLTANRVLLSNAYGKISASDMTTTTFSYLDPTSSLQDQLSGFITSSSLPSTSQLLPSLPAINGQFLKSVYNSTSEDKSTTFETVNVIETLTSYTQPSAITLNSESVLSLNQNSQTRLQIPDEGGSNTAGRIDLLLAKLYTDSADTGQGELRFNRADDQTIRYHSIFTQHSSSPTTNIMKFAIHTGSSSATTAQTDALTLNGSGCVGIGVSPTSAGLTISYDTDAPSENSDDVNLLIKNTSSLGMDAVAVIRGTRNGATNSKQSQLRFENFDDNSPHPQIHTLGAICGEVTNAAANLGDLNFYTFNDGVNPVLCMKMQNNNSIEITASLTVGGTVTCSDLTFNNGNGGTETTQDMLASINSIGATLNGYGNAVDKDTTTAVTSGSANLVTSGGVFTALSNVSIPMASDTVLGGVKIDGGNLNINASGKLSATIVKKQTLSHVGVFNLQATTDLRTETDTLIRWKPAISTGSSGLLHDQDNAIPNGTLFYCNDGDGGVYNINVQIALTSGTPDRSFHVLELRTFTGGSNQYTEGTPSRTYFIGSGYARMVTGTNKCFYGGSIQITMEEHDQFQIVSTRKYVSGTGVLELNAGVDATRLIIDRLIID